MTKKTDEAAPFRWRFLETDCSDLCGNDELLAVIASQCPVSLQLSSSEATESSPQCRPQGDHDSLHDRVRVMLEPLSGAATAKGA